jgi:hypothetical protein
MFFTKRINKSVCLLHIEKPSVKRQQADIYSTQLFRDEVMLKPISVFVIASLLGACHMNSYLPRNSWTDINDHYAVSYQDNCDGFGFARDTLAYDSCLRNEEMLIQGDLRANWYNSTDQIKRLK